MRRKVFNISLLVSFIFAIISGAAIYYNWTLIMFILLPAICVFNSFNNDKFRKLYLIPLVLCICLFFRYYFFHGESFLFGIQNLFLIVLLFSLSTYNKENVIAKYLLLISFLAFFLIVSFRYLYWFFILGNELSYGKYWIGIRLLNIFSISIILYCSLPCKGFIIKRLIYNNNTISTKLYYHLKGLLGKYVKKAKICNGINEKPRTQKIIISMTSYPARFPSVVLPLKSILLQTVKADRIIVWLGSDSKQSDLTEEMKMMEKYGVEYIFDSELNLKPHKKYFYALQQFKKDLVITVDDDLIYSPFMIESLLESHEKYPNAICARRVHKVLTKNSIIAPYNDWFHDYKEHNSMNCMLFPTNGAGTLFPPDALPMEAFDIQKITSLCLNADDVWLWFMSKMKKTPIVWCECIIGLPLQVDEIDGKQGLAADNVENCANDKYIKNLIEFYGLNPFKEESENTI